MAGRRHSFFDTRYFPQAFYICLTLLGCIFIAVTKSYDFNSFVSIAVPIAIMFGYLAASWFLGKLRVHDEQTGDNLYYMGFLFTLSSLGVSLYRFGTGGTGEEIVQNFGIAVTSTITGIALRIFYNQVRRDPTDVERAARYELTDMTRRVRSEMESVAREFADFRRVCNQMLEEGFDEIARQAEKNGEQVRQAFDGMAAKAIQPVQETSEKIAKALEGTFGRIEDRFSGIADKVDAVAISLDKANDSMGGTVSKFETQADTVAMKLSKVVIPDEVLKTDVVTVLKVLAASVGKFTEKAEALSAEQGNRTDKLSEAVLKMAAMQKMALEKLEKQTEEEARTRQLMIRALERSAPTIPADIPTVAPVAPVTVPSEPPAFAPITEPAPRQEAFPGDFPSIANGFDASQHPVEAPEPVSEKRRTGWWR